MTKCTCINDEFVAKMILNIDLANLKSKKKRYILYGGICTFCGNEITLKESFTDKKSSCKQIIDDAMTSIMRKMKLEKMEAFRMVMTNVKKHNA